MRKQSRRGCTDASDNLGEKGAQNVTTVAKSNCKNVVCVGQGSQKGAQKQPTIVNYITILSIEQNRIEQNRIEQNRIEQNKILTENFVYDYIVIEIAKKVEFKKKVEI